jgi:thioredoxin 1
MEVADLTDKNYEEIIAATESGLILFHKKLCPHCLNMKKVIEKFIAAKGEGVSVMYMDSEENPKGMQSLDVERVPTLLIVKKGKVAATKSGLMNPRELAAFYQNA